MSADSKQADLIVGRRMWPERCLQPAKIRVSGNRVATPSIPTFVATWIDHQFATTDTAPDRSLEESAVTPQRITTLTMPARRTSRAAAKRAQQALGKFAFNPSSMVALPLYQHSTPATNLDFAPCSRSLQVGATQATAVPVGSRTKGFVSFTSTQHGSN